MVYKNKYILELTGNQLIKLVLEPALGVMAEDYSMTV